MAARKLHDRTIVNPVIGDEVTFLVTSEESGGEYGRFEIRLSPGGGNELHFHSTLEESFEAVEGVLHLELDGRQLQLRPGEKATVKRNAYHRFYNPGSTPITFLVELRPPGEFEACLRMAYGLARDGRVSPKGVPKYPLEMAVLFRLSETYVVGIPLGVQKFMAGPLYRVARWLGVERRLRKKYCPS
ncbi:cupin domain-containing protein [Paenibacillus sp.]|uniref:cupin domain-containing protein n=1 Tax=Paenibacillus sp. TaxID=58172 RepID=UPI002D5CB1E4|nr:cupin domain-containing protein [Paenibacillus sp.]HZG58879.1 cupin domain-containing protein [Paenibacillus sp.]